MENPDWLGKGQATAGPLFNFLIGFEAMAEAWR